MSVDGQPRWAGVVVNYEAGPLLVRCVRSLMTDDSGSGPSEVVVVDNASRDGSVDALRREVPGVEIVHAPGNVGYARAANLGVAASEAPVVAVLNPDTVVSPGTGDAMAGALRADPSLGMVALP